MYIRLKIAIYTHIYKIYVHPNSARNDFPVHLQAGKPMGATPS